MEKTTGTLPDITQAAVKQTDKKNVKNLPFRA
jgi:hypothetical protein